MPQPQFYTGPATWFLLLSTVAQECSCQPAAGQETHMSVPRGKPMDLTLLQSLKWLSNLNSVPLGHRPKAVLATQRPPPPARDTHLRVPRARPFVGGSGSSPSPGSSSFQLLSRSGSACSRNWREMGPPMLQEEGPWSYIGY